MDAALDMLSKVYREFQIIALPLHHSRRQKGAVLVCE